jgi:hypothetical protein
MHSVHITKKILVSIVLLGIITASGFSNSPQVVEDAIDTQGRRILLSDDYTWRYDEPDVPNLYWGMSMEQVRKAGHVRFIPVDESTMMAMNVPAFTMNGMQILGFEDDRLVGVIYLFNEHHADGDLYIADYETLVEQFISEYGQPQEDLFEWVGEESAEVGKAFLDGRVEMATRWETERSMIMCGLANDAELFGLMALFSDRQSEDFVF